MKVRFNRAPITSNELEIVSKCIESSVLSGGAVYTKKATNLLTKLTGCNSVILTPSCSSALEMCSLLLDISFGDEIIAPSYTFVTSVSSFALHGASIRFVDVDPNTMCMSLDSAKNAISENTKAIIYVNYGGTTHNIEAFRALADSYKIPLIEDSAQSINSFYKNKHIGTFGDLATLSFHDTKNITSGGEGGALLVNNERFLSRALNIRDKGTNRSDFVNGIVDKYTWVENGGSHLMSELQAAYLFAQLQNIDEVTKDRLEIWYSYYNLFSSLKSPLLEHFMTPSDDVRHNGHLFFLKFRLTGDRDRFIAFMKTYSIDVVFHYVPLHLSPAGQKYGKFIGEDKNTLSGSSVLVRLPIYNSMTKDELEYVLEKLEKFFGK